MLHCFSNLTNYNNVSVIASNSIAITSTHFSNTSIFPKFEDQNIEHGLKKCVLKHAWGNFATGKQKHGFNSNKSLNLVIFHHINAFHHLMTIFYHNQLMTSQETSLSKIWIQRNTKTRQITLSLTKIQLFYKKALTIMVRMKMKIYFKLSINILKHEK